MGKHTPSNPYVVGQTLKEDYGFYGRQKLVDDVVSTLKYTLHKAIVLHGQRRIGKSSLLHRLRRDVTLQESHIPIFFDLQQRRGFPLARLLSELAEKIILDLELDISIPDEDTFSSNYNHFRRQVLAGVYDHIGEKQLLILMDEFDEAVPEDIAERLPGDSFIGYLQNLMDDGSQQLSFIFVVGQRLDLLAEGYRRLFRSTRTQPVGRLEKNDAYELLVDLGKIGQITYSDESLARIWDLTNGHPYLNQLLGYEIFERLQQEGREEALADDVDPCIDKAMAHGQGALDWFWTGFNREEQLVLAAIAEKTGSQPSINEHEIDEILQKYTLFVNEVDLRQSCKQLTEGDFLEETGERQYKFAVEFIRRWIIKNHSLQDVKRQIDKRDPEALQHFHGGQRYFEKGDPTEAAQAFRQAIKIDPNFVDAHRGLARSLNAQGKVQEALDEWEAAYALDPQNTRKDFIEVLLSHIHRLEELSHEEEVLIYAHRVLKIHAQNPEARQSISRIHLKQAQLDLDSFKAAEAAKAIEKLKTPVPIINDADVAQAVRKLWHGYSQLLIKRKPPRLDEAQAALDNLVQLALLDEETSKTYNEIVLAKVRALLEKDQLEEALKTLQTQLKRPFDPEPLSQCLRQYSIRQIEHQRWSQATDALEALNELVGDEHSLVDLLNIYSEHGHVLARNDEYTQAISVYQKGHAFKHSKFDFQDLICSTYLAKANWHLIRHKLSEAESCYSQALALQGTETTQQRIYMRLQTYFDEQRQKQDWPNATESLQLLEALNLFPTRSKAWNTTLALDRATAELEKKRADKAFAFLSGLDEHDNSKIKAVIRAYLRRAARRDEWAAGEEALKHLASRMGNDRETADWQANWLFSWSQAIIEQDKTDKQIRQSKDFSQRALSICNEKTQLITLTSAVNSEEKKQAPNLRQTISGWLAEIILEQAQACLDQGNISKGQAFFKEALSLPSPPKHLTNTIREKLKTVSQFQIRQENWDTAQAALKSILALEIGGPEVNQLLVTLTVHQAEYLFKADQPEQAFSILTYLKEFEVGPSDRDKVVTLAYQFSRLYAGRNKWTDAVLSLRKLGEWLSDADPQIPYNDINILNQEQLDLVRGMRWNASNQAVSSMSIELLVQELRIIEKSYQEVESLQPSKSLTLESWMDHFVETNLSLGRAYLANQQETEAILIYRKIVYQEDPQSLYGQVKKSENWADHYLQASFALGQAYLSIYDLANAEKVFQDVLSQIEVVPQEQHQIVYRQISQSFYDYCEKILSHGSGVEKWDKAQAVLESLRKLLVPAPYGSTDVDLRIDGMVQRIILLQTQDLLAEDNIEDTFANLNNLPKPWPEGQLKEIVWHYSDVHCSHNHWENAIGILSSLDRFLAQERDRDQRTLEKLVIGLTKWGKYLENAGDLEKAAETYCEALKHSRDTNQPKDHDVIESFIGVTLRLANRFLDHDPLTVEKTPSIKQACQRLKQILSLPEHSRAHERQLNNLLYAHASKLAERELWDRAHQTLDELQLLYQEHTEEFELTFATWRKDLVIDETQKLLEIQKVSQAFTKYTWLYDWLNKHKTFDAIWPDSIGEIKNQVDHFTQNWFKAHLFRLSIQALDGLTDLSPDDVDIRGWQVEARCKWGQWEFEKGHFTEAMTQYDKAMEMAPMQDIMPPNAINELMIETFLAQADQRLNQGENTIPEVIEIYRHALTKRNDDVDPSDKIRLALKRFSDRVIQLDPPNWELAHRTLKQLIRLNLHNDETATWQQELTLAEIKAHLSQDDLKSAFGSLETLERPWPTSTIKKIVAEYCHNNATTDTYHLAIEALQTMGDMNAEDPALRQWVIAELTALGEALEQQDDLSAAGKAFEAATDFW